MPTEYSPFMAIPAETETVLGQLQAIAAALREVDPLYRLGDVSWSASISALSAVETTFYSANDETVNMAIRWNAGHLQAMRLATGRFLITHSSPASLVVQPVISLEDEPPWECPPEVDGALRAIPGVTVGAPLTVEDAPLLHSSALALWPEDAVFAQEMLGVGSWDSEPDAWREFVVVFERPCPPPAALHPSLDIQAIIQRARAEGASVLKSNRRLDPHQPLASLGFDDIAATILVMTLEQAYGVKIPSAQVVEHGPVESLTLQRIAELILSAVAPAAKPPPIPQVDSAKPGASFAVKRWLMIAFWGVGVLVVSYIAAMILLSLLDGVLMFLGVISQGGALYPFVLVLQALATAAALVLGVRGRLPGTKVP
jgi:acyl carrier protein